MKSTTLLSVLGLFLASSLALTFAFTHCNKGLEVSPLLIALGAYVCTATLLLTIKSYSSGAQVCQDSHSGESTC